MPRNRSQANSSTRSEWRQLTRFWRPEYEGQVGIWEERRQRARGWSCTDPQGSCWHRGGFGVTFTWLVIPGWSSPCHSWTGSLRHVSPISSLLPLWSEVHFPFLSKGNDVLNRAYWMIRATDQLQTLRTKSPWLIPLQFWPHLPSKVICNIFLQDSVAKSIWAMLIRAKSQSTSWVLFQALLSPYYVS